MAAISNFRKIILSESVKELLTDTVPTNFRYKIVEPVVDVIGEEYISPKNKFHLNSSTVRLIYSLKPRFGFNGFGETVFMRTYSRLKSDGANENWADVVIRVTNGTFTIRKDYYKKNRLAWKEDVWQKFATEFALAMFQMHFLPSGRALQFMGTDFVATRGSAALYNCAFATTKHGLLEAAEWAMDMLMYGCGVGFDTLWDGLVDPSSIESMYVESMLPNLNDSYTFIIPDSREGWCGSVYALINAFLVNKDGYYNKFPIFDYSLIRPIGAPIKNFGGISGGVEPLKKLHRRLTEFLTAYCKGKTSITRCVADVFNSIGDCVVAGNIRRSAQIALGEAGDNEFINLKNTDMYPERADISWLSNNSVNLRKNEDFENIPTYIQRIMKNGEPGMLNWININRFARYGRVKSDNATGMNPCGETPLSHGETCNLAETYPTRCVKDSLSYYIAENQNLPLEFTRDNFDEELYYKACMYATFITSTVTLLPTHREETNSIVSKNRRIGVGISGIADWLDQISSTNVTRMLKKSYKIIESYNAQLADDAGIPPSIRLTVIKPSGTLSQLVGCSSGVHFPIFKYAIRRMRIAMNSVVAKVLIESGIPYEKDVCSDNTYVFEFPIDQGNTRESKDVSIWEQFSIAAMLQREFADNSVSVTINYHPGEEKELERATAMFIPVLKAVSILPHTEKGAYAQMPYEGITKEEYLDRVAKMPKINWKSFTGSEFELVKYCTNDECEVIKINK